MKPEGITHPLTPEQLRAVGAYLYDDPRCWQTPLASALGCPVHSVENWASGRRKPRQWVAHRLRELVKARNASQARLAKAEARALLG